MFEELGDAIEAMTTIFRLDCCSETCLGSENLNSTVIKLLAFSMLEISLLKLQDKFTNCYYKANASKEPKRKY